MKRWVAVGFPLRRKLESTRLSRKVVDHGSRYHHVVDIDDAADVDDELLAWLVEAFLGEVPAPVAATDALMPPIIAPPSLHRRRWYPSRYHLR